MEKRYPTNPVENPDRVSLPAEMLEGLEFIEPIPADLEDIARVHGPEHIGRVKTSGLYDAAVLAAGGAICAAEQAVGGDPADGRKHRDCIGCLNQRKYTLLMRLSRLRVTRTGPGGCRVRY